MQTPPWDPTLRPDIALLIALPEEFRVLADDLSDRWFPWPNPRFHGHDFLFVGEGGYRCAATILPRMGPTPASQVSARLLALRPAAIVNLGIAGSFKKGDLRIGDVIVPRQVDAYDETGKQEKGWQRRGEAYRPDAGVMTAVQQLEFTHRSEFTRWVNDGAAQLTPLHNDTDSPALARLTTDGLLRDRPAVSTNHLASGSFVVASKPFAEWLREANADIHAGEMEAAGMMAAAEYQREPVVTVVIRGISDHVHADKSEVDAIGGGGLRRLAMENTWRLACTLMRLNLLPRVDAPSRSAPSPVQARIPASPAVLATWREKLDFLLGEEPLTTTPDGKFSLKKQIEEARAKIREYGGDA
jgi:nucleoside phosphorylase